jgi:hypothetical protein
MAVIIKYNVWNCKQTEEFPKRNTRRVFYCYTEAQCVDTPCLVLRKREGNFHFTQQWESSWDPEFHRLGCYLKRRLTQNNQSWLDGTEAHQRRLGYCCPYTTFGRGIVGFAEVHRLAPRGPDKTQNASIDQWSRNKTKKELFFSGFYVS